MSEHSEFKDLFTEQEFRHNKHVQEQNELLQHKYKALHDLMASKSGRIFIRDFLNFCNVFADPNYKNNEHLQFCEGLRRAGMYVFSTLAYLDASYITKIFKEED